jgi:hypothetical protein
MPLTCLQTDVVKFYISGQIDRNSLLQRLSDILCCIHTSLTIYCRTTPKFSLLFYLEKVTSISSSSLGHPHPYKWDPNLTPCQRTSIDPLLLHAFLDPYYQQRSPKGAVHLLGFTWLVIRIESQTGDSFPTKMYVTSATYC